MESLEGREVPAAITWQGDDLYSPTSFTVAENWDLDRVPEPGDDIYYDGAVSSVSCYGLTGYLTGPGPGGGGGGGGGGGEEEEGGGEGMIAGSPNSVHLVNEYAGTVTVTEDLTVNVLELDSVDGAISQPDLMYDNSISVAATFTWTGGTLNSSGDLNTVHLLGGSTTTVTPPEEGELTTGSDLSFEDDTTNGSIATFNEGTVNFNNTANFVISALSEMTTTNINFVQANDERPNYNRSSWYLNTDPGMTSSLGRTTNEGTITIAGGGTADFYRGDNTRASYTQIDGETRIHYGSKQKVAVFGAFSGGKLTTRHWIGAARTATFQGELRGFAADVVIGDYDTPHVFGILCVTNDVEWIGGTYRPVIDASNVANSDVWVCQGKFTVGAGASIAPGAVNIPTTGIPLNQVWKIMDGSNGIVGTPPTPIASWPGGVTPTITTGGSPVTKWYIST